MVVLRNARCVANVVSLSTAAQSPEQYRRACLDLLQGLIGFDGAVWGHFDSPRPDDWYACGVSERPLSLYRADRARYQRDMQPWISACAAARGVAQDVDVYARRELDSAPLYTELIRPEKSCSALAFGDLSMQRQPGAPGLLLGRARRKFRAVELEHLRDVLPAVALGDAYVAALADARPRLLAPHADHRLSPREREVLEYATLGLTTQQIALALGTSSNTVKHQLRGAMRKLGAGSRAELVRIALLEVFGQPARGQGGPPRPAHRRVEPADPVRGLGTVSAGPAAGQ